MTTPTQAPATLEKFAVRNRWSGEVQFTAEIATTPGMLPSVKLGLAVKWGVANNADLAGADLADAYLAGADLAGADLAGAYLAGAYLARADLAGADLADADLADADLAGADLAGADLAGADLAGADLADAYLAGADLADAKNIKLPHFQLPDGDLIGWKALSGGVICKLRIPPDARRTASVIGRKCRAEYVEVLEGEGVAIHDHKTEYKVGQIVRPDSYDDNPLVECTNGIHFFATRQEAEEWA